MWDEERIDEMLENGRRIMNKAIQDHKPVAIFAGLSGGNDSVVTAHFACTEYGATAIHCNTLIGIEKSREHARKTAQKFGWSYEEKKAVAAGPPKTNSHGKPFNEKDLPTGKWMDGDTAYEEFVFNFGMPGPGQHPRMYQRLKERSFDAFKREAKKGKHHHSRVMFVTGIRHDESAVRAGYRQDTRKIGGSVWVNPFYWQTKVDFGLYREEFGLPRSPVSDIVGISGECLCGTFGTRAELDAVEKVEPQTRKYIEELENKCESLGLPCRWATRPSAPLKSNELQLSLFGEEPDFQPACVGCIRRNGK